MARIIILLLVLASSLVAAKQAKEFTLQLSPEEWQEIGDPAEFEDDLLIMKNGSRMWGRVKSIPNLHYSFGKVEFEVQEVAGISFADSAKMQVVARNGQNFIGRIPDQPLNFEVRHIKENQRSAWPLGSRETVEYVAKKIPLAGVDYVLIKQRGRSKPLVHERFHSVILANGDRFPIIMATDEIHLTDGWADFTLDPKDIVDVQFKGGLQGYLRGEGLDTELRFSFVKDKFLPARLAKNGDSLKLPWSQIARIKGDMGEFILTTPYQFSQQSPGGMVYIPPGRFVMGPKEPLMQVILAADSPSAARGAVGGFIVHRREAVARGLVPTDSAPSYIVEMPGFFIDKHEVTNEQYLQFVEQTGHRAPPYWIKGRPPQGMEKHPVVEVTYSDAESYARWAGKRLPTEVEWERAAKGATGAVYPYGEQFAGGLSNIEERKTRPVGSYAAAMARFGAAVNSTAGKVLDMTGNVAEWTRTPFRPIPVENTKKIHQYHKMRPTFSSSYKVVRGGAYTSSRHTATTVHRSSLHERDYNRQTGFRCVTDDAPTR